MTQLWLCRLCGDKAGSNPKCVACRTLAGSLAVAQERRRAGVLRDMERAAAQAPAGRGWRYVAPGRNEL